MAQLDLRIPGIVWIDGDLYCKTQFALEAAVRRLVAIGYDIKDERAEGYSIEKGLVTVDQMEQDGWSLWRASMPDIRTAKCGSCNGYISTVGSLVHGHTCELCGAVIYLHIINGSTLRFSFVDPGNQRLFAPELHMEAQRWEAEEGFLYLKPTLLEDDGLSVVSGEEGARYLALHADKWVLVEEEHGGEKVKLYKIHYRRDFFRREDKTILMRDIHGHQWNYQISKVWGGVEYPQYSQDIPGPESFNIFETWH